MLCDVVQLTDLAILSEDEYLLLLQAGQQVTQTLRVRNCM
jgi:hypothetical protein